MNGRALFEYKPDIFQDDENAGDVKDYEEIVEEKPDATKVEEFK